MDSEYIWEECVDDDGNVFFKKHYTQTAAAAKRRLPLKHKLASSSGSAAAAAVKVDCRWSKPVDADAPVDLTGGDFPRCTVEVVGAAAVPQPWYMCQQCDAAQRLSRGGAAVDLMRLCVACARTCHMVRCNHTVTLCGKGGSRARCMCASMPSSSSSNSSDGKDLHLVVEDTGISSVIEAVSTAPTAVISSPVAAAAAAATVQRCQCVFADAAAAAQAALQARRTAAAAEAATLQHLRVLRASMRLTLAYVPAKPSQHQSSSDGEIAAHRVTGWHICRRKKGVAATNGWYADQHD